MPKHKLYSNLDSCRQDLIDGKIGIIPSDTIYGLVVKADLKDSVNKIFKLKRRSNKPGTIMAANINQLVELGFKKRYLTAVDQFWPGPISVIIPTGPALEYLHHGLQSLAVRIPADKNLLKLLKSTGPLMSTSANISGKNPADTIQDAIKIFGDKIDFYVDGGDLSKRLPSTIIRILDDAIEVIREGVVKIDEATGRFV